MKAPIAILVLGLGIGLVSVLFSAPIFAFGVWRQSEPVVIAVHTGAALCWLGLALAAAPRDLAVRLKSFLVAPAVALALWGALAAALSDYPMLGIVGPPQTGQGALWSLDFAAYVAAAWMIRDRRPGAFHRLVLVGAVVVLVVGVCNSPGLRAGTVVGKVPGFFSFPKFLAFSAMGLFPAAWAMRGAGNRAWIAVLAIAMIGVVLSENHTALASLLMILPILMLWRWSSSGGRRGIFIGLSVVAVAVAALAPYVLLRQVDWLHGTQSLWSRSILLVVVDRHIFDGVASALFGHGWGSYQEYLARHVAETGISLVDGSWQDLTRDEFHSHSAVIEAAFAAGLPGAALAVLQRIGLVMGAASTSLPMALAFASTLALTEATWFMLPVSLAFLAVGAAALAPRVEAMEACPARFGVVRVMAAGSAGLTLILAALLLSHAVTTQRLMACIKADSCAEPPLPYDPRGQGLDLAAIITGRGVGKTDVPINRSLTEVVRRVAAQAGHPRSALLSLALVNTFGRAAVSPERSRFGPLSAEDEILWREKLIRLMDIAPGRMDVAAIYLNWLVRTERDGGDDTLLPTLERRSPSHPVVLWFRGLRMVTEPTAERQRQGLVLLRRALDGGIGRYIQVPSDAEVMVRKALSAP